MTDKEIIIDGVDVSGCFHYKNQSCIADYLLTDLDFSNAKCAYSPNCHFKQLQRKTQECEQKEKELLSNEKIINKLMKEVDELKQECEKLKNQVDEDYNYYTTELKTLRDIISNKEKRNAALFLMSNRYRKALEEIETVTKINCEEICGRKFTNCKDTSCFSVNILDIINKAKGGYNVGF